MFPNELKDKTVGISMVILRGSVQDMSHGQKNCFLLMSVHLRLQSRRLGGGWLYGMPLP